MIFYPIQTLIKAGITDILIIIAPDYSGHFLNLLGSGNQFGATFSYEIQETPRGLADAFIIGENFIGDDTVAMILGDNIFEHDFSKEVKNFKSGAKIFARQVHDPQRYGVVTFDENKKVISIVEKPENPKSNYAVVGMYIYDNKVIEHAKRIKPSARGEIEIADLHNAYLQKGELSVEIIEGLWEDAGTFDSLLRVNNLIAEKVKNGEM